MNPEQAEREAARAVVVRFVIHPYACPTKRDLASPCSCGRIANIDALIADARAAGRGEAAEALLELAAATDALLLTGIANTKRIEALEGALTAIAEDFGWVPSTTVVRYRALLDATRDIAARAKEPPDG